MVKIGRVKIENFSKPYIIAEIGTNHNGDIKMAKKLIKKAKEAGCDAVKFQSWTKKSLFCKDFYKTNSEIRDKNFNNRNLEELMELFQLSCAQQACLFEYAKINKIDFLSSVFSEKEVDFLDKLGVKAFKIASMDLNNYGFLEYVAKKNKPLILSTGLSTFDEVEKAVRAVSKTPNKKIILLHCVSIYPPKDGIINLRNIDMLRDRFGVPVGYSDHSIGIAVSLAAVARGVCAIERHFTLDRNLPGWDHAISSEPEEMKALAKESQRIVAALGSYNRILSCEEHDKRKSFRRSIVAARRIEKGEAIKIEDLDFKRPGTGLEPGYSSFIINRIAQRTIQRDEMINKEDF